MVETGSQRAYAKHRGVTHRAVQKAVERGRITLTPDGRVDFGKADAQWKANSLPSTSRKGRGARPARGSIGEAMRVLALERARLVRLEYRKRRGELLDADEVERAMFELGRRQRDLLQSVPSRLSTVLAGTSDADEVYTMLEKEMAAICDAMSLPAAVAPGKRDEHERP
jgi:hypothetical protein